MGAVFTPQVIKVGGKLLYHEQTCSFEWPDNRTDVDTVPGGAVGVAVGAAKCTLTIANAVPQAGADFDWHAAWKAIKELEVVGQQIGSTKKVVGTFIIRSITSASGVGEATTDNVQLQSVGDVPIPK